MGRSPFLSRPPFHSPMEPGEEGEAKLQRPHPSHLQDTSVPRPWGGEAGAQLENRHVHHQHLSGTFHVPGAILSTLSLCVINSPNPPTTLQGRDCDYPHFTDEETEAQRDDETWPCIYCVLPCISHAFCHIFEGKIRMRIVRG